MTQRAQGFWQWGSLSWIEVCRFGFCVAALFCVVVLWGIPALALPQGDAITDPRTLLRRALPIQETKLLEIDEAISKIDTDLKYNRWSAVRGDVRQVERLLDRHGDSLLASLPPDRV
ncbi:peptidylprolyl isomerase, partial [Synechococcus sp. R8-2]